MSQEPRRANWLSRVFGADEDPTTVEEATAPATVIRKLESDLAEWQRAHGELVTLYDARSGELERAKAEIDAERAEFQRANTRLGVELQRAKADLAGKTADLERAKTELGATSSALSQARQDLEASRAALAGAKDELTAARAAAAKERARIAAVEASHQQLKVTQDALVKRAEADRAAAAEEREALGAAHRAELAARDRELAALREKLATGERERGEEQRMLGAELAARRADLRRLEEALESARRADREDATRQEETIAGLRWLVGRAVASLDLVLGERAPLAIRGSKAGLSGGAPAAPFSDAPGALERTLVAAGWAADDGEGRPDVASAAARELIEEAATSSPAASALHGRGAGRADRAPQVPVLGS